MNRAVYTLSLSQAPASAAISGVELMQKLLARPDRLAPKADATVPPSPYRDTAGKFGVPGRDHASALLYLQTVEANFGGDVRADRHGGRMRWKLGKRIPTDADTNSIGWEGAKHGTRLWDGSVLQDHDDFDCLEDLEDLGLLTNIGTGFQPVVRLTETGHAACSQMITERGGVYHRLKQPQYTSVQCPYCGAPEGVACTIRQRSPTSRSTGAHKARVKKLEARMRRAEKKAAKRLTP